MPEEKQPRKPISSTKRPAAPVTPITTAGSTAQPAGGSSHNAVIIGNASLDLTEVRRRAYELYEKRGRLDGFAEHDWRQAEEEVRKKSKKSA